MIHRQIRRLALLTMLLLAAAADATAYDLVIRNGRIVDGTGNPAFFGDVAVEEGRIARVGRVGGKGRREIDARGLIVAPGFIDVHTHVEDLASQPRAENFARMGVTTLVTGNCGTSALEVGKALRQWERAGIAVNVATLIGHRAIHGGGGRRKSRFQRREGMRSRCVEPPPGAKARSPSGWITD